MQPHLTEVCSIKGSNSAISHAAQKLLRRKKLWAMFQDIAHGLVDIKLAEVVRLGSNSHWCLSMLALPHQQVPHLQDQWERVQLGK